MADQDERLESRVAKIESDVAHIGSTVAVIQTDLRELRRETIEGFKALDGKFDGKIERLRKDTGDGFQALEGRIDGKIDALRKETADGFKEARKRLRTDLGLFLAALSLLASAGFAIARLVFTR